MYLRNEERSTTHISSGAPCEKSVMRGENEFSLWAILECNECLLEAIDMAEQLALPNWYIGAGCVVQTVWNYLSGLPINHGIKDVDLVYYDPNDRSDQSELATSEKVKNLLPNFPLHIDVNNQARVHLWYEQYFGYPIEAYKSVEDAIDTWPTTATATAVRKNGSYRHVYSPFGLGDLFSMTARPNKRQITRNIYEDKVNRWKKNWPKLTVVPWESEA